MLNFLLELSFWQGILLIIFVICLTGILVILSVKKLLSSKITKQHEKVGRLLFRVTAGLIALLLSLSYANERVGQSKVIDSLEEEATMIINSAMLLDNIELDEAKNIQKNLAEYVKLTLTDEWETVDSNPYFSDAANAMSKAYFGTVQLETTNEQQELLKHKVLTNLDEVTRLMQIRIYSEAMLMPYLIYILCFGILFMWVFYTVYKIDTISLLFITLYNIFVAVLIYFVFAMSNPLVGPLKIKAHAFEIIYSKGYEQANK